MSDPSATELEFAATIEQRRRSIALKKRSQGPGATVVDPAAAAPRAAVSLEAPAVPAGTVDALLDEVEERAAVSGCFEPDDLFRPDTNEATIQAVLSRLAPRCIVGPAEGGVRWLLHKERRTAVLSRLVREGRLAAALDSPLPPTDLFGERLRELLRSGTQVPLEGRTRDDLLALATSVEATADVGLPQPDSVQLRQRIGQAKLLADYDNLLAQGFVGREEQLKKLWDFLETSQSVRMTSWSGLMLTGLGGAGKSTLLAKFARDVVAKQKAMVVILDFDRPGIDPNDLYWLESEIARQVGRQVPTVEERLRQARQEARQQKVEGADQIFEAAAESVTFERSLRHLVLEIRYALDSVQAGARPFLLVLDTFEEVVQRDLAGRICEWLSEIADKLWPLRVIFSGRLFERARMLLELEYGVKASVVIDELEPRHAEELMRSLGVPEPLARRLASSDILPRRPLELKLLARIARESEASAQELEEEVRNGGPAARELFAGIVYRRVLLRIRDETARALAYPGLVLRYVTPELIQKVLVPALELPPLEDTEAALALAALAAHDWLAYRGTGGEVWHRKDLRRSMLKAMIAQEPATAKEISRKAIEFFAAATEDREWTEGVYHRLLWVREPKEGQGFELAELKKANEHISGDIADLPPAAAALLRFAAKGEVTMSEVGLLPDRYFPKAYRKTGQRLVHGREFGKALEFLVTRSGKDPRLESWETETLFATASWDQLAESLDLSAPARRSTAFKKLVDLLFPIEIIAPWRLDPDQMNVKHLLLDAAKDGDFFRKVRSGAERDTVLQRLAICLVLMNRRSSFGRATRDAVAQIVARVSDKGDPSLSISLERRLVILGLVGGEPSLYKLHLSVTTLRLDPVWLSNFPRLAAEAWQGDARSLDTLQKEISNILLFGVGGLRTARRILGAIDALSRKSGRNVFELWPSLPVESLLALLQGPNPEFRDPCRFALLEAFPDPSSQRQLAKVIRSVVKLDLEDLAPDAFAAALASNPEHALESYVELVDRAWALGELLRRAHQERPDSPKLRQVLDAYERWDEAVVTTILNPPR